ncbi:MAG: polysaccharide biosynthesis tyrosine autokinase [Eubacteriales bacterium]|nr:polysaccharide biosynthesis tyrosine autokinase [Eubacteriales bacterium]
MKEAKYKKVNLQKLLGALWQKKILIGIISVFCAIVLAVGTWLFVTPKYQADILVYVNNSSISLGGTSLSFTTGELTAARQLLDSYVVALKSRTCLDAVIKKAGLPYTRAQLRDMIVAESVNQTEWFTVVITSTDPNEARIIADTIAEIFPDLLTDTIKGSSVEVVDCAAQPSGKVAPNLTKSGAIGFLLGFIWTCVYICIRELIDDKVHGEGTLNEFSNTIPVLANIPHRGSSVNYSQYGYAHKDGGKRGVQRGKSFDDCIGVCDDLDFAAAEAYKLLQTSVQYSFEDDGCKVVGITSSERNEGKSTLAINLAYMLSCDKKKVLLLEGDMRLPSIARKLGIDSTPGLSDYLTGKIKNDEGVQYSAKAPALSVICAGVVPPNPFGLLGSASMERLLASFKEVYDYIIVDLPPVNIVSDPLAIAKYLDGFIITVRSEFTTRQGVQDVVKKLQIVNSNILGYVVNSDDNSSERKYGKGPRYGNEKYGRQNKAYEKSYERAAKRASAHSVSPDSGRDVTKKHDE